MMPLSNSGVNNHVKRLTPKQFLSKQVDELGELCARMAELETDAKRIKDWLKQKYGDGAYEGELFRATVSTYDQDRLNMDAVRAKLSAQFIRANTTTTEVCKCTVVARNAQNLG